MEYDWRTRFGVPLTSIGDAMSWGEAYRLTAELSGDPTTHLAASIGGWDYPVSREALVIMDLFDLQYASKTDKRHRPKPYPRPWPDRTKRHAKPTVSQETVLAALRMAGHTKPPPLRSRR